MSTQANLNNIQSQRHNDSIMSTQKKGLFNITLGGQSKLSRPISSYQKYQDAEAGSPEVLDGISSEEEGKDDDRGQRKIDEEEEFKVGDGQAEIQEEKVR